MAFERITPQDTAGKGVVGLPDTPDLSTEAMQRKLDELSLDVIIPKFNALVSALLAETGAADIGAEGGTIQEALNALQRGKATVNALDALKTRVAATETQKADKSEVLRKGAGEAYTPAGPYDPATRKYVDDTVTAIGAGDMSRAVYDTDDDGVVDNASALGGKPASFYAPAQHAAGDATHGAGSSSLFGHVKLSDSVAETLTTGDGTAATPKAVKAAYDRAGTAVTAAQQAAQQAAAAQTAADNAMPKSGGTFTGTVKGTDANLGGNIFRNIAVANSAGTWQATNYIIMQRK